MTYIYQKKLVSCLSKLFVVSLINNTGGIYSYYYYISIHFICFLSQTNSLKILLLVYYAAATIQHDNFPKNQWFQEVPFKIDILWDIWEFYTLQKKYLKSLWNRLNMESLIYYLEIIYIEIDFPSLSKYIFYTYHRIFTYIWLSANFE